MTVQVLEGDCRVLMAAMESDTFDSIVTDPPYGLEFMGKEWDSFARQPNHRLKPSKSISHDVSPEPRAAENPWQKERSGYGAPRKNPRCKVCGHTAFSGSPCRCEAPEWDTRTSEYARTMQAWHQSWATEALRVLKPGGYLLAFGGTRTFHRLTCAIEDAGFEIRDCLSWLYGSGFPKSLDVSKAIDKANGRKFEDRYELGRHIRERREALGITRAEVNGWFGYRDGCEHWERQDEHGARVPTLTDWAVLSERLTLDDRWLSLVERVAAEREVVGTGQSGPASVAYVRNAKADYTITAPTTDAAREWDGWGTALKPAWEPIILARKPLSEATVVANVLKHGTGAINVDGCRIGNEARPLIATDPKSGRFAGVFGKGSRATGTTTSGRWPANLVLDEDAAAALDEQSGERPGPWSANGHTNDSLGGYGGWAKGAPENAKYHGDTGGASRYFYTAKASRAERTERVRQVGGTNSHPTVKPVDLMRWLCRLVTRPGGHILDPFVGSGSTLVAALMEGFDATGIDLNPEYVAIARQRIDGIQLGGLVA